MSKTIYLNDDLEYKKEELVFNAIYADAIFTYEKLDSYDFIEVENKEQYIENVCARSLQIVQVIQAPNHYDPVLSYLFAREDHIVTETAKNTKEIVMVSKHQVTYLFRLLKKTQQKNYTKCINMLC